MSKLSEKKRKKIKRLATNNLTNHEIAKEMEISIEDVQDVLEKIQKKEQNGHHQLWIEQLTLDRIFFALLFIFICLAPFAVRKGIYDFANLPQTIFIRICMVSLLILWLLKETIQKRNSIYFSPFHLPIFLFLLWSIITIAWAPNRFEGVTTWMQWVGPFLAFLIFFHTFREKFECKLVLIAIYISGIGVGLLGILQYLLHVQWVPQVAIPAATFANKNMAAHYGVLTIPLGAGFFIQSQKKYLDWFYALTTALLISFLYYTIARAAYLSFALECIIAGIILFFEYRKGHLQRIWTKNKTITAIAGFVLVIFMIHLTPTGFQMTLTNQISRSLNDIQNLFHIQKADEQNYDIIINKIDELQEKDDKKSENAKTPSKDKKEEEEKEEEVKVGTKQSESSFAGRYAIWRNSWEMIKDYFWFGVGLGNHKVFYPLYFRKVVVERWFSEQFQLTNAHNDYVQTWSETGSLGMLFLLWLAIAMFFVIRHILKYETEYRYLVIGITVAISGLLINAFCSFPFQRALPPLLMMLYLSVLAYLYFQYRQPRKFSFPIATLPTLVLFVFIGLVLLIRLETRWFECDKYYLRITSAEKAKSWKGVINEAKIAIRLNPYRRKILSYMGRAYIESGDSRNGIEALKKVIEVYPNHMNAMLNLGVAYGNVNEYDNALDTYKRVINIKPDYAKVHNNIANIFMKQQMLDEALEEFRLAAQFDDKNPVIHFNVGIVALNKKYYEEAEKAFKSALELNPKWDMAHKNLGVVLYQYLNRKEEGAQHFKEALKINPKIKDYEQMQRIIDLVFEQKKQITIPKPEKVSSDKK